MEDDVSNMGKPSSQLGNNQNDNLGNVTNAEQCEFVSDSLFGGDLQLEGGLLDPALSKEDIDVVEEKVPFEDLQPAGEIEHIPPSNDFAGFVKAEEEIESLSTIELVDSIGEVEKSGMVVSDDGSDAVGTAKEKAEELHKPSDAERYCPEEIRKVSNNEKYMQLIKLDDVNLAVSESASVRDDFLVDNKDNKAEDNEVEPQVFQDTAKCKPELDDPKLVVEPGHALKNCKGDAEFREEGVSELEYSPLVSREALALKGEDVVTTEKEILRISEPSKLQLDQESELAAVDDVNKYAAANVEETQMEVTGLDDSQLLEDLKVCIGKEKGDDHMGVDGQPTPTSIEVEDGDMGVKEKKTGTGEQDGDMGAEEKETPSAKEDTDEDVCAEELQLTKADKLNGDDIVAERQSIPTSSEVEGGDMFAKRHAIGTREEDGDMDSKEKEIPIAEKDKDDDMCAEEMQITISDEHIDDDMVTDRQPKPTSNEVEDGDVFVKKQEIGTGEEDRDMGAKEKEIPTSEDDQDKGICAGELQISTADEHNDDEMVVNTQPIPTSNEVEDGDMGVKEQEIGTGEEGGDMSAKEKEIPTAEEDKDGHMCTEELQITTANEHNDDDMVANTLPIPTSNEVEDGGVGAKKQEIGTGVEDGDMGAKEKEPTAEEDNDEGTGAEELQITIENKNKDDDMGAKEQGTPTSEENENVDMGAKKQEMPTAEDDDDDDMCAEEQDLSPAKQDENEVTAEPTADMEMPTERSGTAKRKRGRSSTATPRVPVRKLVGEDVCFICFDGGDLVLCDRRGCTKAYHPSCVNRDEAFFRAKGRWNCGWHLCSICEKNAHYMCYTCTYSVCKVCMKDSVLLCVKGNKGLCDTCMKTVMLIENNELGKGETDSVDFNDKSSWEYLFKDYWSDLKEKLQISLDEVAQAKNPCKGSDVVEHKPESSVQHDDANNNKEASGSDNLSGTKPTNLRKRKANKRIKPSIREDNLASASENSENQNASNLKKRKSKKRLKSHAEKDSPSTVTAVSSEGTAMPSRTEWGSKELLEFVMHMNNGDSSALSQFDVQALLLEYIKKNKLRDPRRKSQIICDWRLENLFGKTRVGHFEMLKLLESHFLIGEDSSQIDDLQGIVVDHETSLLDADTNIGKDKKRKTRRKGVESSLQSNIDDYAAIDTHNINLVYLRRNVIEALLDDPEYFHYKVVGCFVRIRITGSIQKHEMYRLVHVIGTRKSDRPYKVVKKTTDIMLEIQNLNKKEVIAMDIVSNQEFTEDECKRLRQSIKCGLINRLTLGDIQEKALALQEVRVNEWLEAEVVRLGHLRDRASDTGRMKELRECVEKLQRLKTPEERQRRLEEFPQVHADPKMDPSYESEEDESEPDDKKQDNYMTPRSTGFSRRGQDPISPHTGSSFSNESRSRTSTSPSTKELSRNMSNRVLSNKIEDASTTGNLTIGNTPIQDRNKVILDSHSKAASESVSRVPSENLSSSISPAVVPQATTTQVNETEKMWLYRDPSGKVQGPFSMGQLRKWSHNGYFPKDLKIWRNTENEDETILLTNALDGKFQKDSSSLKSNSGSKSDNGGRTERSNLPSPTPSRENLGQASATQNSTSPSLSTSLGKILEGSNSSHVAFSRQPNNENSGVLMQGSENTPQLRAEGQFLPIVSANQSAVTNVSNGGQQIQPQNHPVPVQQPVYNQWGTLPDSWGHMQPMVQPNQSWPMDNSNIGWVGGPAPNMNPNQGWVVPAAAPPVNPNQGWVAPGTVNPNWVPTAPVNPNQGWVQPGNPNQNWTAPPANLFPGWVAPGNINPGWIAPNQMPAVTNTNPGWVAPVQGTIPGNNPGWVQPNPTPVPSNSQPSFGNGGGPKGNKVVCGYYMNGHCRNGASCDRSHT